MSISARISRASTPVSRWTVCVLCILWYLLIPIANWVYYSELRAQPYPTHTDSIGIAILESQIAWQRLALPFLAAVAFAVATNSGGHSFLLYDRAHPIWSLFWSAPSLLFCVVRSVDALCGLRHLRLLELAHTALFVYLLLAIRSSLVAYAPKLFRRATNVA